MLPRFVTTHIIFILAYMIRNCTSCKENLEREGWLCKEIITQLDAVITK